MTTFAEFAELANSVYQNSDTKLPNNWGSHSSLSDTKDQAKRQVVCYSNPIEKKVVFVFEGINIIQGDSLEGQLDNALEKLVGRRKRREGGGTLERAEKFVREVCKQFETTSDYKVIFVGHSLGGSVATILGIEKSIPVITFNGLGCQNLIDERSRLRDKKSQTTIINFVTAPDLYNTLDQPSGDYCFRLHDATIPPAETFQNYEERTRREHSMSYMLSHYFQRNGQNLDDHELSISAVTDWPVGKLATFKDLIYTVSSAAGSPVERSFAENVILLTQQCGEYALYLGTYLLWPLVRLYHLYRQPANETVSQFSAQELIQPALDALNRVEATILKVNQQKILTSDEMVKLAVNAHPSNRSSAIQTFFEDSKNLANEIRLQEMLADDAIKYKFSTSQSYTKTMCAFEDLSSSFSFTLRRKF